MSAPVLFRLEAGDEEIGPIGGCIFGGDCSPENTRGEVVWRPASSLATVLFKLGVSEHSKVYVPVSREIVAQLEARKTRILLGNSDFGRPYFEPGGRGFESLRARQNQRLRRDFS